MNEMDTTALWTKETPASVLSGLSRFRRWLFPAVTATVIVIVMIILGTSNASTSSRLWSMEQRTTNLSSVIQSLNASLQQAQETLKDVKQLKFALGEDENKLTSVAEALKQLSVVDSLSKSVAVLKCSLERLAKNGSLEDGCCPLGWDQFSSKCFLFSSSSLNWNESRVWCEQHDANLLMHTDDKEWAFVTRRSVPVLFWVGLSDWRTGRWEWVNGSPYDINRRRWRPGQPDSSTDHGLGHGSEDCARIDVTGRLDDVYCQTKNRFICQMQSLRA